MTPLQRWRIAYAVPDLDGYERAALLVLAFHANDDLQAWPSLDLIATEAAFSRDTCRRAIRRLIAKGIIRAQLSAGRSAHTYTLTALQPSPPALVAIEHMVSQLLPTATVEPSPLATVAHGNGSHRQCQPSLTATQPSPPATRTKENNSGTKNERESRPIDLPEWLSAELWASWKEHRREIGHPLKPTGEVQNLRKLTALRADGNEPAEVIGRSIESGWRGLFPTKQPPSHADAGGGDSNPRNFWDGAV